MKRTVAIILCWVLVVAWMGFIFFMSSQNADISSNTSGNTIRIIIKTLNKEFDSYEAARQQEIIDQYQTVVRKIAHFSAYGLLGTLCAVAICLTTENTLLRIGLPWIISALYAATDEIHQHFVPGRSCELRDVFIDSCGAFCGILFIFILFQIIEHRKEKKHLSEATF